MFERLAIRTPDGRELAASWLAATGGDGAAVLLLVPGALGVGGPADDDGRDFALEAARRLASAGYAVLAPDLCPLAVVSSTGALTLPDRPTLAALEVACAELRRRPGVDPERVAAVGFGDGGRLAFLFGCVSSQPGAVASVHGGILYAELGPEHPVQPLELLLNLGCPFLGCFGAADPELPRGHVALLRAALEQGAKAHELVVLDEAGPGFFDPRRPRYHAGSAEAAWSALQSFLSDYLV
jgi:carboxymethylenebutenolidase